MVCARSFFDFFIASEISEKSPEKIILEIENLLWGDISDNQIYWDLSTKEIILFTASITSSEFILSKILKENDDLKTLFKPLLFLASEIVAECEEKSISIRLKDQLFKLIEDSVEVRLPLECGQRSSFDDIVLSFPKEFLVKIISNKKFDDRLRVSAFHKFVRITTKGSSELLFNSLKDNTFSIRSLSFAKIISYSSFKESLVLIKNIFSDEKNWELKVVVLKYLMNFRNWVYYLHFPSSPAELERCKKEQKPRIHILSKINDYEHEISTYLGVILLLDKSKPKFNNKVPDFFNRYILRFLIDLNCSIEYGLSFTKYIEEFDLFAFQNNLNKIDAPTEFIDEIKNIPENCFEISELKLTIDDINFIVSQLSKPKNKSDSIESIKLDKIIWKVFNIVVLDGLKRNKILLNVLDTKNYINKSNDIIQEQPIEVYEFEKLLKIIYDQSLYIKKRINALKSIDFLNCQHIEKELASLLMNSKEEIELRHNIIDLCYEKNCKNLTHYLLKILSDPKEDLGLRKKILEIGFYLEENEYSKTLVDILHNSSDDMSFKKDIAEKICDFKPMKQFARIEKLMLRHLMNKEDYIEIPFELVYAYFSMVRDRGYCGIGIG